MTKDKISQYVGLFGGLLSAVLLFLGTLNIEFKWFNADSIGALEAVLIAIVPFILLIYGVYKNSYIITDEAKRQEAELKRRGLK